MKIDPGALRAWSEVSDRVQKTKTISESDWLFLKQQFNDPKQRTMAIAPIMFVDKSFAHRTEAIAMLEQFLTENHEDGNVVAVIGLRKLGEPSWKRHASRLMQSGSEASRETARIAFERHLAP